MQEVGILEREIRPARRDGPGPAAEQGLRVRQQVEREPGGENRHADPLDSLAKLWNRAGHADAVAREDDGPPGCLSRRIDLPRWRRWYRRHRLPGGVKPSSCAGSMGEACTSSGMSIQTGPGRPVVARCTAFSRWKRMLGGSVTVTAYLVMGMTIGTISISWEPSCRSPESPLRSARFTWPQKKAGRRIQPRARAAGDGIGAGRAGGDHRHAQFVGRFRSRLGGDSDSLLVQHRDERDLRRRRPSESLRCIAPPPGSMKTCLIPSETRRSMR